MGVNAGMRVLWAKKAYKGDSGKWLSLESHLSDVSAMVELLWSEWVADGLKEYLKETVASEIKTSEDAGLAVLKFVAYTHDMGKATPSFQARKSYAGDVVTDAALREALSVLGIKLPKESTPKKHTNHALQSYLLLKNMGYPDDIAVIAGGHHGVYPEGNLIRDLKGAPEASGTLKAEWLDIHRAIEEKALSVSGLSKVQLQSVKLPNGVQVLLTSLVIVADWLVSNTDACPLVPLGVYAVDSKERAKRALDYAGFTPKWKLDVDYIELYTKRFKLGNEQLRSVQQKLLDVVQQVESPGLFIVEAPMGCGKTEAALIAAEVLAGRTGRRGVYFALPTQATSNAVFSRLLKWLRTFDTVETKLSARLLHGKASFNDEYMELKSVKNSNISVLKWFDGSKSGILADFVVGTVDAVLLAGLRHRHVVLRHLGLASKVVVIDECHAYDVYMKSYLLNVLRWLGAYGVPVVVLSATLPSTTRKELLSAYMREEVSPEVAFPSAYPLITYTDGSVVRMLDVAAGEKQSTTKVYIERITDEVMLSKLRQVAVDGGCAGVVVNTVKRAQALYALLESELGDDALVLLHARFLASDRARIETSILNKLGNSAECVRPKACIVIGTQVLEQSLDIDFDVLFTDLCPMDLLLQRIGRLHRHFRWGRPVYLDTPVCYVLGADLTALNKGSVSVYGDYLLMRTCVALPADIELPTDIPVLVDTVYTDVASFPSLEAMPAYVKAQEDWQVHMQDRERRAKEFQVRGPYAASPLVDWLKRGAEGETEAHADAAVRDGSPSIEVVLLQKRKGKLCFLPWVHGGIEIGTATPKYLEAKDLAGCTVRLPSFMGSSRFVSQVIEQLEASMVAEGLASSWSESSWLSDALCLVLDEEGETVLAGIKLKYTQRAGLHSQ